MAVTGELDPNAEVSIQWGSTEATNLEAIIDDLSGTYVYTWATANLIDVYDMETAALGGGTVSSVAVWIFVAGGGYGVDVDLYISGAWQGYQRTTTVNWVWDTITFAGLNASQADLDAMRVRIKSVSPAGLNGVAELYAIATYGTPAAGPANIDEMSGIPSADIDEKHGIAWGDIEEIFGVS